MQRPANNVIAQGAAGFLCAVGAKFCSYYGIAYTAEDGAAVAAVLMLAIGHGMDCYFPDKPK